MTEQEERQSVVAEALTWEKTPYHPGARLKGVGVDCGMLLLQVFENVGLVEHIEIPYYPQDIACHSSVPMYLNWIKKYSREVKRDLLPGDVLVYQFPDAQVPHHAAIVITPEIGIHSYVRRGVERFNLRGYNKYMVGIYSFWH